MNISSTRSPLTTTSDYGDYGNGLTPEMMAELVQPDQP